MKGYVTDTETRGSVSFAVGKDNRFSTTVRLGSGLNTLHSYVRYLLLIRYTLPDFTVTVGPVPRTIISLQVGSPRMTVNGMVNAIDAQRTRPLISNRTTMVPIRAVVESLGGCPAAKASEGGDSPKDRARYCACRVRRLTLYKTGGSHVWAGIVRNPSVPTGMPPHSDR